MTSSGRTQKSLPSARSPSRLMRAAPLTTAILLTTTALVGAQTALPSRGTVASGAATINPASNNALSITQTSQRAIINWNSFSVGASNSVTFTQPDASAAILNRVTGSTPSTIAGTLSSNGQVYLVNPNGIAITPGGTVTVGGGFVASTHDIGDAEFNA